MARKTDLSPVLYTLFLCLGVVLIAGAENPTHYAVGGVYMICSLAFAVLG